MPIDELVEAFEACTLPPSLWNHRAHLTVALFYLQSFEASEATRRIREGIQRYNRHTGKTSYHDTLTLFWIEVVRRFLAQADAAQPRDALTADLLHRYGDKNLPLQHYSRELLFSAPARAGWVEPDLKPL